MKFKDLVDKILLEQNIITPEELANKFTTEVLSNYTYKKVGKRLKNEGMHGDNWASTSWTDTIDGEEITVTLKDMLSLIKDKPIQEIKTKILEPYALHKTKTDEQTLANVQKANLEFPIIVLHHPNKYQILDGHHRLQKTINNKLATIKARVIELTDMPEVWQKVFI